MAFALIALYGREVMVGFDSQPSEVFICRISSDLHKHSSQSPPCSRMHLHAGESSPILSSVHPPDFIQISFPFKALLSFFTHYFESWGYQHIWGKAGVPQNLHKKDIIKSVKSIPLMGSSFGTVVQNPTCRLQAKVVSKMIYLKIVRCFEWTQKHLHYFLVVDSA